MYWNRRITGGLLWIGPLLLVILLTACNPDRSSSPTHTLPLSGMHFLAEAEVSLHTDDPSEITIEHQLYLFNAGSDTCNGIHVEWQWPDELGHRLLKGSWTGPTQPFEPKAFDVHIGTWAFALPGDDRQSLVEWVESARISIACHSPIEYNVTVVPRLISLDD